MWSCERKGPWYVLTAYKIALWKERRKIHRTGGLASWFATVTISFPTLWFTAWIFQDPVHVGTSSVLHHRGVYRQRFRLDSFLPAWWWDSQTWQIIERVWLATHRRYITLVLSCLRQIGKFELNIGRTQLIFAAQGPRVSLLMQHENHQRIDSTRTMSNIEWVPSSFTSSNQPHYFKKLKHFPYDLKNKNIEESVLILPQTRQHVPHKPSACK